MSVEIRDLLASESYEAKDGTKKWNNYKVGKITIWDDGGISIHIPKGVLLAPGDYKAFPKRQESNGRSYEHSDVPF